MATKNSKKKATVNARSLAAKKAWITIRANKAKAKKKPIAKTTKPSSCCVGWTNDFVSTNKPTPAKLVPSPKQKLVKGLIKNDTYVADWEKQGQFGVADINKRGISLPLTNDTLLPTPKANQYLTTAKPYTPPPVVPKVPKYSKVKDLLSTASRWRKSALATDTYGRSVDVNSPEACQFCLSGAVDRVYAGYSWGRTNAINKLQDAIRKYSLNTNSSIVSFNDSSSTSFTDLRRVLEFADV